MKILPEEKQRQILKRVKELAGEEKSELSIWDKIREHASHIPDEEWARMPVDGADQHDHYLYGTPKK